ncbi:ficolin-2-like [Montipora capricornis]|uniref:ficolin-2-like n=1 Tax=Montipora capricornis TaxID=246305 RepID=UPI0035F1004F
MDTVGFKIFPKAVCLSLPILLSYALVKGATTDTLALKEVSGGEPTPSVRYANFIRDKFAYLNIGALRKILVEESIECALSCLVTLPCFSFNLAAFQDNNDKLLCEHLSSDKYNNSDQFVASKVFHHFSIFSPCSSGPCKGDRKCVPRYAKNSYLCVCKTGFTGENCEHDIDECSAGNNCDLNVVCVNTEGSYYCTCNEGYTGDGRNCTVYKNCADVYNSGEKISGVYIINPDGLGQFEVYCDHKTVGGGWTVFQKRQDGSVDFFRAWYAYKRGFGNLSGEFWLGLDKIHRLTANSSNKLRVDLEDNHGNTAFAEYSSVTVASERAKYQLSLGKYSGTAGDSLGYHRGHTFTTKDRDNDNHSRNCALTHKGAWWYNRCHNSNLNGLYQKGMIWYHWKNDVKRSEMKIRPQNF